jgi:hypothetical protein
LEYFRLRRAWDGRERVASADVVLLKEAQGRYAGKHFDELYGRWRQGRAEDSDVMRVTDLRHEAASGVFRTLVCGSSLKVFADPRANSTETSPEPDLNDSLPEVSGSESVQVSGS